MKLLELYESLFQYICRLNRMARTQSHPDIGRVRAELKSLFEEINRVAATDVLLHKQVRQLERPLVFFIDNLIVNSRLNFAGQWASNRLAYEWNELAGDECFFVDFLDKDIQDPGEEAAHRLAVYYICLTLGFTGMYQGQPEQIRKYMDQIFPRIRQWMDTDTRTKISEQAYACTVSRQLTQPPADKIYLLLVIFVFLSLCVLFLSYGLYFKASSELTHAISEILRQGQGAKP